ncbi:SDR family oxidoreductase [Luteibacter aegosomatissinici]|uniref:SDR family oxidoreductase n=1 Tax=Luteibacter aegosomatissinici TaxID=2911539 RepID=UPI001FF9ABD4|nr:SDR family oxidoreductase [Luteibacter aegosomatissinici]UPG92748.1 SDR family oxidoreductase [Luteibacter aegosomatissinici]
MRLHSLAGPNLMVGHVDIDDASSIHALREELAGFRFDVVFVNAGVLSDPALSFADQVMQVMRTNVAGAMLATEAFEPLVADGGVLAVMSSGLGSVSGNTTGGWEPYRSSKAALNQSLRSFAAARPAMPYALAAIAPGWVRTEMGGPDAALDVATSTSGMVRVLEGLFGKPGLVFVDYKGNELPW